MGQVQTKERVEDQGIMLRVRDGTSPDQGKSVLSGKVFQFGISHYPCFFRDEFMSDVKDFV